MRSVIFNVRGGKTKKIQCDLGLLIMEYISPVVSHILNILYIYI